MIKWLKDFFQVYSWKEFWLVVSVPTAITGVWILLAYMLAIENDVIRGVLIWGFIFVLCLLTTAKVDWKDAIF